MTLQEFADKAIPIDGSLLSRIDESMKKGFVLGGKYVIQELQKILPSYDIETNELDIDDAVSYLYQIDKKLKELKGL